MTFGVRWNTDTNVIVTTSVSHWREIFLFVWDVDLIYFYNWYQIWLWILMIYNLLKAIACWINSMEASNQQPIKLRKRQSNKPPKSHFRRSLSMKKETNAKGSKKRANGSMWRTSVHGYRSQLPYNFTCFLSKLPPCMASFTSNSTQSPLPL